MLYQKRHTTGIKSRVGQAQYQFRRKSEIFHMPACKIQLRELWGRAILSFNSPINRKDELVTRLSAEAFLGFKGLPNSLQESDDVPDYNTKSGTAT